MAQELTFPIEGIDDSESSRKLQTLATRQRVDLIRVELELGRGFVRIAQMEYSAPTANGCRQSKPDREPGALITFPSRPLREGGIWVDGRSTACKEN